MAGYSIFGYFWIASAQFYYQFCQPCVLNRFIGQVIGAFQLYADAEVVTAFTATVAGDPGMPGTGMKRHILDDLTIAAYQDMGRDPQLVYALEVGMVGRLELVGKQLADIGATELTRGQADVVDHHQADRLTLGACVTVP